MSKQTDQSEAARLRQLAHEKQQEQEQAGRERDVALRALDEKWRAGRAALGPKVVPLVKAELLRQARLAAERGVTGISVDLGVNEDRLRTSSSLREITLAEAVLAREPAPRQPWDYVDRVGWLLQTRDGQVPSEHGDALLAQLQEMGFSILFLPFFVQDNCADPFSNARLEIQW